MSKESIPVIFLAYANDRVNPGKYLRNLVAEIRGIRRILEDRLQGHYEPLTRGNANLDDILRVFDQEGSRIAVFHFAGHADSLQLMLENEAGGGEIANAGGFNELLARQKHLRLVFLNGCTTWAQAEALAELGVGAVIATAQTIKDGAAAAFAQRFYERMAAGVSVAAAFDAAQTKVRIQLGDTRAMYWESEEEDEAERTEEEYPWRLYGNQTDWRFSVPEPKLRTGKLLHLMCDRDAQVEAFLDRLEQLLLQEPQFPHFYFIHGLRTGRHKSLVQRFRDIDIRHNANRILGPQKSKVDFFDIAAWPTSGDLEMRQRNLKRSISRSRELPGIVGSRWQVGALVKLLKTRSGVLVFQHTITADKWDTTTYKLLDWYIHEFWNIQSIQEVPRFVVFFNIVYPKQKGSFLGRFLGLITSRQDIREDMDSLCRKSPERCTILSELQPVSYEEVANWVDTYFPDALADLPGTLFDRDHKQRLPMEVVETQLKQEVERLERRG